MIDLTAPRPRDRPAGPGPARRPRRTRVLGERAGALRVAVTAAPEKGKANAAIADVLAEALGCKASQVGLLSGETSREKRFLVGSDPGRAPRRLERMTRSSC